MTLLIINILIFFSGLMRGFSHALIIIYQLLKTKLSFSKPSTNESVPNESTKDS